MDNLKLKGAGGKIEEHLIAISQQMQSNPGYWIMVVGTVHQGSSTSVKKIKTFSEGGNPFVLTLKWLNHQAWKIFIVFTIYITIIVTHLMLTQIATMWFLVIVHQVCSIIYAFDLFLAIIHRTKYLPAKILAHRRCYQLLVIDVISILPFTPIYFVVNPNYKKETIFGLSCIAFLRFYRVCQFFTEASTAAGIQHLKITLFQYTLYLLQSLFSFSIWWMTYASSGMELGVKDWNKTEENIFFVSLYFSFMTFTNTGFGDIYATTISQKMICSLAMLTGFTLTSAILVGSLTSEFLRTEKDREKYRRAYETTMKKMKFYKLDKLNQARILCDLNKLWKYKRGISDTETFDLFPVPLRKEICFDLTFGFLNRSPLFSYQDRSFLRSVSLAMKNRTYMPGDEINHPTGMSHALLCVSSGVIELLSRENDDSPIVSFTSGTLLCEISLFKPVPLRTIIRAATIVELQTLNTVDFYRLVLKYPENYQFMKNHIKERIDECRKNIIYSGMETLGPDENIDYRLQKLKQFIENLRKEDEHRMDDNFPVKPESSMAVFKSNVLNLYVLTENLPRLKSIPITLVRNKPWIFRPDTPFLNAWRHFIFLSVTVVIFSYPYLAAFVRKIDHRTFTLLIAVQFIYIADIVIQCLTAVPRNDLVSYKTSLKEIIGTRLKSYGFYLDVLSSYHFEVFAPLFMSGSNDYICLLLSMNKLLKIWFIPAYFKKTEDELSTNLIIIRMFKCIYYVTWLLHFCSAVLYLEACPTVECHPDRWFSNLQTIETTNKTGKPYTEYPYVASLYLALMGTSTAGFGNIEPSSMADIYTLIILIIMGLITFNYCIAELSVTFRHRKAKKTEFQEQIFAIDRFLVEHNLPDDLRKRVSKYFQIQWSYDEGGAIKVDIPLEQLPNKLRRLIVLNRLRILQAVPLFKGADPGFLVPRRSKDEIQRKSPHQVLAKGCKVRVIPENEMVVYAGGLDKEMYIVQNGYCRVTDKRMSLKPWVIGPLAAFGDLEMIQGIPVTMNVRTLTHARIICIEHSTYLRAVTKYPNVRWEIEMVMESKWPKKLTSTSPVPFRELHHSDEVPKPKKSLSKRALESLSNSIINVYKYDKRIGLNYWTPFLAWRKFHFFKYIFLPFAIKPDSLFLYVWMSIRIISSLMLGFLIPIYLSIPSCIQILREIVMFLGLISWLDLYIICHVAYYDNKGILTFHPAKTVVHYLKSNFALDFLLVFPYSWIPGINVKGNDATSVIFNIAGLLRVFQFYKFLQACTYYESYILRRAATLKLFKYLITILIITNVATGILLLVECVTFDPDEPMPQDDSAYSFYRMSVKIHCSEHVNSTAEQDVYHSFRMYFTAYYWITATLTSAGFGDIVAHNVYTLSMIICNVLLGVFLYGSMFASVASSKICIYYNVVKYRARMREMMMFLRKENIDRKMQHRFFSHYLYVWNRTLGHLPQHTLTHIHTALKQDIVDCMYEKTLRKVSVFTFTEKPFMRSIGKCIDEVYFLKGETIAKRNHILTDLYIIYKGEVCVYGPTNELIMCMGAGGLFGNISEKSQKLSSITAITASKVELIRLRNEDFHKTLLNYPDIRHTIMSVTANNQDYIPPHMTDVATTDEIDMEIPDESFEVNTGSLVRGLCRASHWTDPITGRARVGHFYLHRAVFMPPGKTPFEFVVLSDSWLHHTLRLTTTGLSYISCILTSYVFAFQDFRVPVLVPYIVLDIFFYLKIFMELHYTYFDSRGYHIHNMKALRKRYLKSKTFYIDLFANLPLDIIAFFTPAEYQYTAMSILRLNRLLRFYCITEYYNDQMNSLMIRIIFLEVGTLCARITLLIHICACMWYMAACPIFYCESKSWLTNQSLENAGKFEQYISAVYYIVTLITTTGYGDIVAWQLPEILLATLIMIISHFVMLLGSSSFLAVTGINSLNFIKYDESIMQLKKDLIRRKISKYQLSNVWQYLQLLWLRENGKQIPRFIESAPYIMKCDVYTAMYGEHVCSSYIFRKLDEDFLRQLTIYLVRYVFFPGNYIVQQGDNDGTMYFIHKGEVSVMTIHKDLMETIHYNVKDNDQFGISQGLIFGRPHQFSYRAVTEVEILSLTLSHWQHLFKLFPKVKPIIYERLKKMS